MGWKFKKLIEVVHRVHGSYKGHRRFRQLLLTYNRQDQIQKKGQENGRQKVKQYTLF